MNFKDLKHKHRKISIKISIKNKNEINLKCKMSIFHKGNLVMKHNYV